MSRPHTLIAPRPDGAALEITCVGTGPTVLLISGLGGTGAFWRPVVRTLSAQFTIVAFDQRGIGASSRGTDPVTIETLADDARAVLDELRIQSCIVVGHSTGGCIAMMLGAEAPDRVAGLMLSATWLRATPYMTALFTARRALLTTDARAYASLGAMLGYPPEWLTEHWTVHDTAIRQAPVDEAQRAIVDERIDALLAFDGAPVLPALAMPCRVIGARDDMIVPLPAQRALHASLAKADLAVLETGGHFFPVTRTDAFCAELSTFATGVMPAEEE